MVLEPKQRLTGAKPGCFCFSRRSEPRDQEMRSRHRVTLQTLAWTITSLWCSAHSVSYALLISSRPRASHAAAPRSKRSFSNVAAVKAEEPLSEVKPSLDAFDICSNNDSSQAIPLSGVQLSQPGSQSQKEKHDGKVGIWAARGILLIVAALWGTNFAVREHQI